MAETPDGQQKSEAASGKKLSDARDRGQIAKSTDVTSAAVLLFGGTMVYMLGAPMMKKLTDFLRLLLLNSSSVELTDQNIVFYARELFLSIGMFMLPLLGVIMAIGFTAEVSQVGFKFATKKFTEGLNFGAIFNIGKGLKRIFFSSRSMVELLKSVMKMFVIGVVIYQVIAKHLEALVSLAGLPYQMLGSRIAAIGFELIWKVGLAYAFIAAGDWMFQKYKFREEQKMTKQEVKEEGKQTEGDAQTKSRMRAIGRQRLKKIMLQHVRQADVVITNPTHYAVALQYKTGSMSAPVVVAKGVDFLAAKIREIATEANVPIVENPPLARSLYAAVEVDQEIPENLFKAVAQILAFVYRAKNK
ncbi:MAG: flagellar biosynthesis protein FlhB [Ignavibacteria bacterium]|nr:flagellar biosynthesis protein FlhB [Ignavibacteria bacterium]